MTDEQGAIADSYRYDAYGNPVFATNVYYNPHRYGGKYGYHSNLNPAGLVLAGARWYSPNLRRWMSRDPIGYDGGDNLFEYVDSSPTKWVDPQGLVPFLNESKFNVPYKHEEKWANKKLSCPPGATCNVDGVFLNGWENPPIKVPNGCSCTTSNGSSLQSNCLPGQKLFGLGPRIFKEWKNPGFENWDPSFPINPNQK